MMFTAAIEAALQARDRPVITELDLYLLIQSLLANGHWCGTPLKRLPREWDHRRMNEMVSRLFARGTLKADRDFARGVYRVADVERAASAEEVACLVDPFCYLSHASAMRFHGFRKGVASPLRLSTPERKIWMARWITQIQALEPASDMTRPAYPRVHFGERIRRRTVIVRETASPAEVVEVGQIRVSAIGATFADMLAEPALCGGIKAVLAVWARHAREHVNEIVAAVDRSGAKIDKVRAGYIFTERLGVETPAIWAWLAFAQRGGSRKLDPEQPYSPVFSERWMLSLNVPTTGEGS